MNSPQDDLVNELRNRQEARMAQDGKKLVYYTQVFDANNHWIADWECKAETADEAKELTKRKYPGPGYKYFAGVGQAVDAKDPCPTCKGTGSVMSKTRYHEGEKMAESCPACKGTGKAKDGVDCYDFKPFQAKDA